MALKNLLPEPVFKMGANATQILQLHEKSVSVSRRRVFRWFWNHLTENLLKAQKIMRRKICITYLLLPVKSI
jgi:hypothetical protein